MKTLKIEMIHDVVCSWCHIGYHNISKALDNLLHRVSVDFHYLPFQLNPELDHQGVDITEHLCQRNQWSLAEAMEGGADVRGYLYWSYVDNYEWNHGFDLRFGLYALDEQTKARSPRPVVERYREIIESNGLE